MPVPTGAPAVSPTAGVFGLLLSWTQLPWMKVHYLPGWSGQDPSCEGGGSSLASEFGKIPERLSFHSESSMTRWPPEFEPRVAKRAVLGVDVADHGVAVATGPT